MGFSRRQAPEAEPVRLVCQLYGLTKEAIAVVEGRAGWPSEAVSWTLATRANGRPVSGCATHCAIAAHSTPQRIVRSSAWLRPGGTSR